MQQAQDHSDAGIAAAQQTIKELGDEVQRSPVAAEREIAALIEDICGQTADAFSRSDWLFKWGIHYVRSLMFAHRTQQCNNFKDPGVQFYGGRLFNEIRDGADDIFNSLPAPKPSIQTRQSHAPVS